MRLLHGAALTGAVVLLASVASAQSIGEAAAKEKAEEEGQSQDGQGVYGRQHRALDRAGVVHRPPAAAPAGGAAAQAAGDKPAGAEGAATAEKPAEDPRVKAEAEWRQKLEQARKEEAAYQEMVTKLQLALNDTSSLYSTGRASNVQLLEDNQRKLADVKASIASLEEEGPPQLLSLSAPGGSLHLHEQAAILVERHAPRQLDACPR